MCKCRNKSYRHVNKIINDKKGKLKGEARGLSKARKYVINSQNPEAAVAPYLEKSLSARLKNTCYLPPST